MRNLCMVVSYDGTQYHGFQTQPKLITVQDRIEHAIQVLTGEEIKVISSGRTDAGVHARAQVCSFHTTSAIPVERWCLALNTRLPEDIVVLSVSEVSHGFHARRSAKQKTYRYTINANRFPDVFHRRTQFHHPTALDVDAMRKALSSIVGEHDFTAFCTRRSIKESCVRTILDAHIDVESDTNPFIRNQTGILHIYITGSGFLHNMVRIIVGTLLRIGEGKWPAEQMAEILQSRNRRNAGPTAMAHGLTLWDVQYEEEL